MGTHPIFESDFDCLTDMFIIIYIFLFIKSAKSDAFCTESNCLKCFQVLGRNLRVKRATRQACNIMVNRQGCCTLFQPHSGSLYRTYEFDDPDENGFVQIHSCMCEPENFKEQCGLPETIDVPKEILTESDQSFVNRSETLNETMTEALNICEHYQEHILNFEKRHRTETAQISKTNGLVLLSMLLALCFFGALGFWYRRRRNQIQLKKRRASTGLLVSAAGASATYVVDANGKD